ncbi:MAG: head GIN domain-containing protein [Pseudomonadota bacterium]
MKTLVQKTVAGVCAAALSSTALADDEVTRTYDMTGFEAIDIAGVFDLDVTVGPEYSIRLDGPAEKIDRIEVSVSGNTLRLSRKKRKGVKWGREKDGSVHAEITLPSLVAFEASGVVDGDVVGIDAGRFALEMSGVGDIDVSGECGSLVADISGVGDLNAKKLECATVRVSVSGVGDASVFAKDAVDASVSGMGSVDVYGSPEEVTKSGGFFADVTIH